jgi:hypothetical protein
MCKKQLVDGALDREFLPGTLGISSQATYSAKLKTGQLTSEASMKTPLSGKPG